MVTAIAMVPTHITHEAGPKFVNLKRCQDRDGHVCIDGVAVGYYLYYMMNTIQDS